MSINRQCQLLGLSRTAYYYNPKLVSEMDLSLLRPIDENHLEYPAKGVIWMTDAQHIKPYLLLGLDIVRSNKVRSIDISYIPMKKGFMHLTAIIDVYSRFVLAWDLNNSLDASNCTNVFMSAVQKYGVPKIINSVQGSQFTNKDWMDMCSMFPGMKVSVNGRGRVKNNIWIERFWKTIKYEYIYLIPAETVIELREGIDKYMNNYNFQRRNQGIKRVIPYKLYT